MTYKYLFFNDYSEGAHPRILEALVKDNFRQEVGYGQDSISLEAVKLIKTKLKNNSVDVHFVSGGTQANLIALSSMLKSYESVIAAYSSHINMHEAGAIESAGHKINSVKTADGKLTCQNILEVLDEHTDEHMVNPKVVFISQATEVGTIYRKAELQEISKLCKEKNLYLYIDGARLGSALVSSESDLELSDVANLVDMFYIGGTKNGALLGEALIIVNPALKENFRYQIKQHGGLLAKGRVLGTQFIELFKDDLFFELARHANLMAQKLSQSIKELGATFLADSTTNQIFPVLPHKTIDKLKDKYGFYVWLKVDKDNSAIRLVTSWATTEESVFEFLADLKASK